MGTVREHIAGPLSLDAIRLAISKFLEHAQARPEQPFFVTRIGCGLAGHKDADVAPLFNAAPANCSLPDTWANYIEDQA